MQSGVSHLLVIVQIQVKVIGREVAHLNLVGAHKAAEVGFACEVAFTRHAAEIQVQEVGGGQFLGVQSCEGSGEGDNLRPVVLANRLVVFDTDPGACGELGGANEPYGALALVGARCACTGDAQITQHKSGLNCLLQTGNKID